MKKLFLSFCVLTGIVPTTQSISQNMAYVGTFGTALGFGIATHYISNSLLLSMAAAGGSGFVTYQILNQFTAEGRLARARVKFDYITRNSLAMREFNSDQDFFKALDATYILTDLPLIAAYSDMAFLITQGYDALSLLDAAKSESNFDLNIIQQCDILIPRIHRALGLMTEAVRRIRSSSEYVKQVKLYKEMQAAKEKLAVQKEIAHSQHQIAQAQTQMAQAQMHQAYNH